HSERVVALTAAMAGNLNLPARDASDLEMAALLHHLGQVTIDEPEDPAHAPAPSEVATVTSAMLREIKPLAGAGDIVAGDAAEPRRRGGAQGLRGARAAAGAARAGGRAGAAGRQRLRRPHRPRQQRLQRRDRDPALRTRLRLR